MLDGLDDLPWGALRHNYGTLLGATATRLDGRSAAYLTALGVSWRLP
jgi:hypothetical protein